MSRHGHLSNVAAAGVIEQLLGGKIDRVVLGHLSRDCNTPELARAAVEAALQKNGRSGIEIFCADQRELSPRFRIGETKAAPFQPTFDHLFFDTQAGADARLTSRLLRENRVRRIGDAVFDHRLNVGSPRDVIERVRIQNDQIGQFTGCDRANLLRQFRRRKFSPRSRSCFAEFAYSLGQLLS